MPYEHPCSVRNEKYILTLEVNLRYQCRIGRHHCGNEMQRETVRADHHIEVIAVRDQIMSITYHHSESRMYRPQQSLITIYIRVRDVLQQQTQINTIQQTN